MIFHIVNVKIVVKSMMALMVLEDFVQNYVRIVLLVKEKQQNLNRKYQIHYEIYL